MNPTTRETWDGRVFAFMGTFGELKNFLKKNAENVVKAKRSPYHLNSHQPTY
jgi:hypothetical protein